MAKKNRFVYGVSPSPTNWHETAEILRGQKKTSKKSKGPSPLMARLDSLEKLFKDKS